MQFICICRKGLVSGLIVFASSCLPHPGMGFFWPPGQLIMWETQCRSALTCTVKFQVQVTQVKGQGIIFHSTFSSKSLLTLTLFPSMELLAPPPHSLQPYYFSPFSVSLLWMLIRWRYLVMELYNFVSVVFNSIQIICIAPVLAGLILVTSSGRLSEQQLLNSETATLKRNTGKSQAEHRNLVLAFQTNLSADIWVIFPPISLYFSLE